MLQPFEKFKQDYIERLVQLNKIYLVSQSYTRAFNHFDEVHPVDILLSDYDNEGLAKTHLNALKGDKYASLIDLTNEKHASKIREMLQPNSKYALYWSIVRSPQELKRRVDFKYTDHVRRYIQKNTDWRIGADETIRPSMQVIFGELYMILRRGARHELRIKFAEIENS